MQITESSSLLRAPRVAAWIALAALATAWLVAPAGARLSGAAALLAVGPGLHAGAGNGRTVVSFSGAERR